MDARVVDRDRPGAVTVVGLLFPAEDVDSS